MSKSSSGQVLLSTNNYGTLEPVLSLLPSLYQLLFHNDYSVWQEQL